jgi:hypothetical protein
MTSGPLTAKEGWTVRPFMILYAPRAIATAVQRGIL